MPKTITIELPDELYGSIQMLSDKQGAQDLSTTINQILETFIVERTKRLSDSLFLPIVEQGSAVSDISEEHDKHLYGE